MSYAIRCIFILLLPTSVFGLRINPEQQQLEVGPASTSTECWVTQRGHDGFGHQLNGIITTMGVHGLPAPGNPNAIFHFDASPHGYSFEHTRKHEMAVQVEDWVKFLKGAIEGFKKKVCQKDECMHRLRDGSPAPENWIHEIWGLIDGKCDSGVTYTIDNAFFGFRKTHEKLQADIVQSKVRAVNQQILKNINGLRTVFTDLLPDHNLPQGKTVVIHIRLGDSGSRGQKPAKRIEDEMNDGIQYDVIQPPLEEITFSEDEVANQISRIRSAMRQMKYDNVIVHTDDEGRARQFLQDIKVTQFFNQEKPLMEVLSQMVHADVLIASDSSLSLAAALLRDTTEKGRLVLPRELDKNGRLNPPHNSY